MPELYSLHRLTLNAPGEHLFAALSANLPGLSRRQAREAISAGLVTVDGLAVREPKHPLGAAPALVVCDLRHGISKVRQAQKHAGATAAPAERPFTILHEDADLVVVDKAAGIISAPTKDGERGHVGELLRAHWRKMGREVGFLGVIHRLDRDTSGCLCFALNREAQRLMAAQFASHSATRIYRCLVMNNPRHDKDTLRGKIGRGNDGRRAVVDDEAPGKEAITHFTVLARHALGAELEVRLETGRTHQIRIHLTDIACPIYGDRVYAGKWRRPAAIPDPRRPAGAADKRRPAAAPERELPKAPRLMLHAAALELDHPGDGRRLRVEAPIPQAFTDFARSLD